MRFVKFATVGVANTVISVAVFNLCALALGLPATVSNVLAYAVGFVNSFYWNRAWTFADRRHLGVAHTLPRFALVNIGGLIITTSTVWILERYGPIASWHGAGAVVRLNVIEGLAICLGLLWNYTLMRVWVFAGRDTA